MRRRSVAAILMMVLTLSFTACGSSNSNVDTTVTTTNKEESFDNSTKEDEPKKEVKKDDSKLLKNWRDGARMKNNRGGVILDDSEDIQTVLYYCDFPGIVPRDPVYIAYQWDASFAWAVPRNERKVNSMEEIFEDFVLENRPGHDFSNLDLYMEDFRDIHYKDFGLEVETEEKDVVGDYNVIRYTGKHTYTYDNEPQSIPFVAYTVELNQLPNCYTVIMVFDDTINNPSKDPVNEEIIDAYARKMVSSITIEQREIDNIKKHHGIE